MPPLGGDSRAQRVGARIRAARVASGLSQRELAHRIPGAAEGAYISRWERGANMPSWANLEAIAAALDVKVAWLLGENDDDEPEERAA